MAKQGLAAQNWRSRHGSRVVDLSHASPTGYSVSYAPQPATFCLWLRPKSTNGGGQNAIILDESFFACVCCVPQTSYAGFGMANGSTNLLAMSSAGNGLAVGGPAVGQWAFVVMQVTGPGGSNLFWRTATGAFSSVSTSTAVGALIQTDVGSFALGTVPIPVYIVGLKVFPFLMSNRELMAESRQLAPVSPRCTSYPRIVEGIRGIADGTQRPIRDDCSDHTRRFWSSLNVFPADISPPVPEVAVRRVFTYGSNAAPPVTGTIVQTVGGLQQALNGAETIGGTIAQQVGGLQQALNGGETIGGSITQTLGGLRQHLSNVRVQGVVWLQGTVIQPTLQAEVIAPTLKGNPVAPTLAGKPVRPTLSGTVIQPTLGDDEI